MYLRTLKLRIKQRLLRNVRESSQAFEHKIFSCELSRIVLGRYWSLVLRQVLG